MAEHAKRQDYPPVQAEPGYTEGGGFPLYSFEAEQSVIGGILLDNGAYDRVADILRVEHFYGTDHQLLYKTVGIMLQQNRPVDIFTLCEELQRSGHKRANDELFVYIGDLIRNTPTAHNIKIYAGVVIERSLLRRLNAATLQIREMLSAPMGRTAQEIITAAQELLFAAGDSVARSHGPKQLNEILARAVAKIDAMWERDDKDEIVGVPSGFSKLDQLTSGFQDGDLIVVAGRPSMGKSAFAVGIAENVSMHQNKPALIFSLEMPEEQLATRTLASYTQLNHFKLRKGALSDQDWISISKAMPALNKAPLYIDETSGISPAEIRARARRLSRETKGLRLIVVDYLQLMEGGTKTNNRAEQVGEYSKTLKNLAKEIGCPIIALSQVNRGVEQRADKRPTMSDLRESGSIEQDADVVLFVYRDEVYNGAASKYQGEAEIIIAKQRNGPLGSVRLNFHGPTMRFSDRAVDTP